MNAVLVSLLLMGKASSVLAWENADQEALTKTQQLLQDTKLRQDAVRKDEKAGKADAFVNKVTGGNTKINEDIYGLAAGLFEKIAKEADGDPEKMSQKLDEFMRNPAAFYSQWSAEDKVKFKSIVDQIQPAVPSR